MFYLNQHVTSKTPPLPPSVLTEEKEGTKLTRKIQLDLKKQLNDDTPKKKRVSLRMMDNEDDQQQQKISIKSSLEQRLSSEMDAINMMMSRDIKKALYMPQDPLQLVPLDITTHTIEEEPEEEEEEEQDKAEIVQEEEEVEKQVKAEIVQEEEEFDFPFAQQDNLPYQSKQKQPSIEELLYVALDQVINNSVVFELPYATAEIFAPSPPPKEPLTTPASSPPLILPLDEYCIHEEELVPFSAAPLSGAPLSALLIQPYYSFVHEEDQHQYYSNTSSSPWMSSTAPNSMINYNEGKEFTEEAWEAIFHPLSTFKHNNQGYLEYFAWNPTNLPQAAARVAQRVIHATAHAGEDDYLPAASATQEFFVTDERREATLPALQPTPPLKPSPVLTITENELGQQESQLTLVEAMLPSAEPTAITTKQEYYDMLRKIRGEIEEDDNEFESVISSSSVSEGDPKEVFEINNHLEEAVTSRRPSMFLSAILTRKKPKIDINTTVDKTQHSLYTMDEVEKDFHTVAATMQQDSKTLQPSHYWTEKRLFFTGFVCPFLWYYASLLRRGVKDPKDLRWIKRCKLAAIYFTVVVSVISLVVAVKMVGSAASRQAQSDTIRAVVNQ